MTTFNKMTVVIWFLCILTMWLSFGFAAQGSEYKNVFVENLQLGPATSLNLNAHGRSSADIDRALINIYRGNELQPFWIKNGKPTQSGIDIYEVLKNADKHGLNSTSYLLSNIKQFWGSPDTTNLVKLDIVLTLGMMLYVADQREGRLQPRQLDPELFATASDVEVDWKTLFATAFKAADMKAFLAEQAPPFLQYGYLQKKLAEYRLIAAKGGWPSVPDGKVLKPGMDDPRMKVLRERLSVTGEYIVEISESAVFDPELVEAVKRFQREHNLSQDGVIGKQTRFAMNVPVELRVQQIIVNMERYRWLKRLKDERLVAVNIAGFEAAAGRAGKFDIAMPVIVGKTYHKTPVFNDTIKYVDFNPYWNVPPSISRDEILPKLKKDPGYLKKQNMRIFQGWKEGAAELDAMSIDWSRVSKKGMNQYHIRQDPGPNNALGTVKLVFPNKLNVYLHDTPNHSLFTQGERALSHGSIRMGRPAEMAAWVLGGETKGWNVERVNKIIATRTRQVVTLDEPLPVYILYRTAFVTPNDGLIFYNDIYGRDKLLIQALLTAKN